MKTKLTPEQSAKLIELGVSPERASERTFDLKDVNNLGKPLERRELLPVFTLADILDILPKEIRHNGCTYKLNEDDDLDSLKGYLCEELIDTLYLLLVWCLKEGYVKKTRRKRK